MRICCLLLFVWYQSVLGRFLSQNKSGVLRERVILVVAKDVKAWVNWEPCKVALNCLFKDQVLGTVQKIHLLGTAWLVIILRHSFWDSSFLLVISKQDLEVDQKGEVEVHFETVIPHGVPCILEVSPIYLEVLISLITFTLGTVSSINEICSLFLFLVDFVHPLLVVLERE